MGTDRFEVRDKRGGFLWVSNKVFDHFAKQLNSTSFMLYLALCRLANNETQECFPSETYIADMIGVSDRTVRSAMKELIAISLVALSKKGRCNLYTLLSIPENFSGNFLHTGNSELQTPEKYCTNTGSQLPTNKTNNKTQEQDSFNLSPPSSERTSTKESKPNKNNSDPRREKCIAILSNGYKHRGWPFAFNGKDGIQLDRLLKDRRNMTADDFKIWLKNYFASDGVVPGDMPYLYLNKLPRYWQGPLDRFGKLLDCAPAEIEA